MSMDGARFQVSHTFPLPSRSLFFVLGDILEGEVRIGMVVDAGPAFRSTIHAVEMADNVSLRRSWVSLGLRYADTEELQRWQAIAWEGRTLDITAGPAFDASPDLSPF